LFRYNVFTWLPKSLLLQFTLVANVYFLFITILTCMWFSPKNPYIQAVTFVSVLVFTMCKEAYEVKLQLIYYLFILIKLNKT